tara:strand:+ start:415 stop:861 length:447 start_codon:yes stop_codon:yes gene_type:complete
MLRLNISFLIYLSVVKISFCPKAPRMVLHYSYEKPRAEVIIEMKNFLEKESFSIQQYSPEDGFIFTGYKVFDWGEGKRLLALTVHIHDKLTIKGMGKMEVPTSGIGNPEDILKMKSMDKLPYRIQKRIFLPLSNKLDSLGYKKLNHWP